MYSLLILVVFLVFVVAVTLTSYRLGKSKTENAKLAAAIGFVASFFPPLAIIYLVVLLCKEEISIV